MDSCFLLLLSESYPCKSLILSASLGVVSFSFWDAAENKQELSPSFAARNKNSLCIFSFL